MKKFLGATALMLALPAAWGFSPGGPIGNGGDNWQVPVIGYGLGGDIMAPKNIGEEYRRNIPVMYYSYDANFLGYFGLAGTTNVDAAFALMNGVMAGFNNTPLFLNGPTNGIFPGDNGLYTGQTVTLNSTNNLDGYSTDLSEFPLNTANYNYTANALGLVDLKSIIYSLLVENMGLADPVRYDWTLHDRYQPPNTTCPNFTEYTVVERNLDYLISPLQSASGQTQYTPYINDTLYTYLIFEHCTGANPLAVTIPSNTDPYASINTPVATGLLDYGAFYSGLTRDDVAGLRYLMTSNNIKTEVTAPNGSLLLQTNVQAPQLLTTLPISLLLSQSVTNDPGTLQATYPGLTYVGVTTNVVTQVSPTTLAYYTNLPPPYTNTVPLSNGVSIYSVGGTVPFPWSPIQYGTYPNYPILVSTLPLRDLILASKFLDPVALQALYPGLLLGSVTTNFFTVLNTTNPVTYFTNQSVSAVFTNYVKGGLTNGFYFTNQPGPTTINYDITQPFSIISTLDLANFSDVCRTSSPAVMTALYPGLQILRATTFPSYVGVTNYVHYLTNKTGAPYQGLPIAVTKAVSTNYVWITNWNYTFGNILTNHYYTNRLVSIQSISVTSPVGAPYGTVVATTNFVTVKTNQISGDFFIIPTNWCGFEVASTLPLGNPPYAYGTTNVILYNGYNTNGATGTNIALGGYGLVQYVYDLYTNRNYAVYPGICEPVVQWGTNYTTNIVTTYSYDFLNVVTNHYYTNSLVSLFITNVYAIPGGSPDLQATNITVTNYYANIPDGDFYLVPTNWCGYQIISLQTNFVTPAILLTNTTYGTGTVTNLQYTYIAYLSYTNYVYSIRPGFCEPYLTFSTNLSTNIVTQYKYNFGNSIITNSYYTNSPVITVTTNIAAWTNGLVGMVTNFVTSKTNYNGISGDFYVVPPAWCDYKILSTQLVSAVTSTNVFSATNLLGIDIGQQQYSQTTYTSYTNTTFLVQASFCQQVAATKALRRGIQHVQFIRRDYDSLLGQYFTPITNYYTMTRITNSQPITEYYERIVTAPDYLMTAQDMLTGPAAIIVDPIAARGINFDQSTILPGLAGPGMIYPRTTFTLNKAQRIQFNQGTAFMTQYTNVNGLFGGNVLGGYLWASFDGSTNDPVIYPSGTSLANLENQVIMQISPAAISSGTNNVPYTAINFTAQGGQPPYTWSATGLPPGLTFDANTQTLSGTPSGAVTGVPYDITIQLIDAVNRTVNLDYPITIY